MLFRSAVVQRWRSTTTTAHRRHFIRARKGREGATRSSWSRTTECCPCGWRRPTHSSRSQLAHPLLCFCARAVYVSLSAFSIMHTYAFSFAFRSRTFRLSLPLTLAHDIAICWSRLHTFLSFSAYTLHISLFRPLFCCPGLSSLAHRTPASVTSTLVPALYIHDFS